MDSDQNMESHTVLLYHETQVGALCGVHAINTLLQGPYISEVELGQIAVGLDQLERDMMAEGGLESEDYLRFVAQDSGNVAVDGMFSIQVLSKAIEIWGLSCPSLDSPNMIAFHQNPLLAQAFMCNLREHWFTIRQIAGEFWDFNSLFPAPRPLTLTYLETFLATLREQGYSIFVIMGTLPASGTSEQGNGSGAYYTPQQAREAAKRSQQARESGYLKAALNKLVPDGDDPAKQAMRRVTLQPSTSQAANGQPNVWAAPSSQQDEDAELASAIAASLADEFPGTSGPAQTQPAAASTARQEQQQQLQSQASDQLEAADQPQPSAPQIQPPEPPEEPDSGPGILQLALRLPSGKRLVRRFQGSSSVGAVISFVAWHDQCPGTTQHKLVRSPRQVLSEQQSLEEAGVADRDLLVVELMR